MNRAITLLCLVVVAAGFAGCAREPDSGLPAGPVLFNRADCSAATLRLENALDGRCTDAETQKWLDEIVGRIEAAIPPRHVAPRNFGVTLANSREVGLFVFGDGRIVITRGLLARVVSEDELAAHIAAGIAHVTLAQRPVATDKTGPRQALAQKFTPAQERAALERAAFYLSRSKPYNPYAVWGIAYSFEKCRPWTEAHPLPAGGSALINAYVNERFPEFVEKAKQTPLPERIERIVKRQDAYFGAFAEADKLLAAYLAGKDGADARTLETALGHYDKAITDAEAADDLPAIFLARRGIAREMLARERSLPAMTDAAQDDFGRAKQIDPDCYFARLYRGIFYLETKKFYGPAREELQRAIDLNPDAERPGEPYYFMARFYDDPGNPARATAVAADLYRKYLALEPAGFHAPAARQRLEAIGE